MISIIIPVYNEAANIEKLIRYLQINGGVALSEIIVSDGGSTDDTLNIAARAGAVAASSPKKGRAAQMNFGGSLATGSILYFVHADTFPPTTFPADIQNAINSGYECGRYRTKFDGKKSILHMNAFFTRFDWFVCNGGDQSFFISRPLFDSIGGYKEDMRIMEDYDIVTRAKAMARYKIIQKDALVSARKYETNSWLTVQTANYKIVKMYKNGASQQAMADRYKALLNYR